jgi:hypothetical protein
MNDTPAACLAQGKERDWKETESRLRNQNNAESFVPI